MHPWKNIKRLVITDQVKVIIKPRQSNVETICWFSLPYTTQTDLTESQHRNKTLNYKKPDFL